jgi:hypothetical protein
VSVLFFFERVRFARQFPSYRKKQPASEDAEQKHGIDVSEVFGGVHRVWFLFGLTNVNQDFIHATSLQNYFCFRAYLESF